MLFHVRPRYQKNKGPGYKAVHTHTHTCTRTCTHTHRICHWFWWRQCREQDQNQISRGERENTTGEHSPVRQWSMSTCLRGEKQCQHYFTEKKGISPKEHPFPSPPPTPNAHTHTKKFGWCSCWRSKIYIAHRNSFTNSWDTCNSHELETRISTACIMWNSITRTLRIRMRRRQRGLRLVPRKCSNAIVACSSVSPLTQRWHGAHAKIRPGHSSGKYKTRRKRFRLRWSLAKLTLLE